MSPVDHPALAALRAEAGDLVPPPAPLVDALSARRGEIVERMNAHVAVDEGVRGLIGPNPARLAYDNHRNHLAFMLTVYRLAGGELLAATLPWVYRAYLGQRVRPDYFSWALRTWPKEVGEVLGAPAAAAVRPWYDWMLTRHERLLALARSLPDPPVPPSRLPGQRDAMLRALIEGDVTRALALARFVLENDEKGLIALYDEVIAPAMHRVGQLWETGQIGVATEHLASMVVTRLLAVAEAEVDRPDPWRGLAIVTGAPDEHHALGAWILSSRLELDGWEVAYLGTNTPTRDLVYAVRRAEPHLLAMSVTMLAKVESAAQLVREIRGAADPQLKIMVGGQAFAVTPRIATYVGADACPASCDEALAIAAEWWETAQLEGARATT